MKILHYTDLNKTGFTQKIKKIEKALAQGDFSTADVKKMQPSGFYRAKLDRENRLLFQFANYQGETYILLLEVIPNHEYEKSKFLRGATVREENFQLPKVEEAVQEEATVLRYVNPKNSKFHLLDKVISLDDDQEAIYQLPAPLIIIGSAGSGKTALTLEKMKQFPGNVAYLSLSAYLVENSQRIYYANGYENTSQEVDFLSFRDFLGSIRIPKGRELDYRTFEGWYDRRFRQTFKFKDAYKIFEEFKGVLTGSVTDAPYLSRERYLKLGVKQSIFLESERERIYSLFEKYLDFLKENKFYDANIVSYEYLEKVVPQYDFIVVDEVQDITNIQLLLILKALKSPQNFLLSGDSNQIVHPNFFSWSKIKTLFFQQDMHGSVLRILKTNYRNSSRVTQLSNDLLKIKNARFGSIDKESTYLINTVAEEEGGVFFYQESEKIKRDLNKRTENSTKFAVLVMNRNQKAKVRAFFKTPLIFTIQEAKGLEYENIILVNFISDYEREFRVISEGVSPEDLSDERLTFSRAKDKSNKEQEAYKFYVNSLYVAFTRAVQNIHLIETNKKHDLLKLLGVVETTQKVAIETQSSNEEEWLDEAKRLEQQGKVEQAEAIRARLRGEEFVGTEEAEQLIETLFAEPDPKQYNKKSAERLFRFAKARHRLDLIQRLQNELKYGPAKQYMGEYKKAQKQLVSTIRNGNQRTLERLVSKFGFNLVDDRAGMTALMLAANFGKTNLIDWLLKNDARLPITDVLGRTALMHLILGYDQQNLKLHDLANYYHRLAPEGARSAYDGRLYTVNRRSMEYFLLNLLTALRYEVFSKDDPITRQCLLMNDFMEVIEEMPNRILPDYRKKRQYVNSILSKNEKDRDDPYNRKLFIRRSRGCYDLLPGIEVEWRE